MCITRSRLESHKEEEAGARGRGAPAFWVLIDQICTLKLIAEGKLTFDERVVIHRVGRTPTWRTRAEPGEPASSRG